jgi:hypothetical protein
MFFIPNHHITHHIIYFSGTVHFETRKIIIAQLFKKISQDSTSRLSYQDDLSSVSVHAYVGIRHRLRYYDLLGLTSMGLSDSIGQCRWKYHPQHERTLVDSAFIA